MLVGGDGHVRQDGDAVGRDLDEPFAHGEEALAAVLAHDDLARHHLRHERDVLGKDPDLALRRPAA